jgi:hypothetical protein
MNVLVMCTGYPSEENPYNCTWAHIRNRYYVSRGVSVDVVVVGSNKTYMIDGVTVVRHKEAVSRIKGGVYDAVISHSPNMRAHLPFLKKNNASPVMLFMHGSESMSINHDYPPPYGFVKDNVIKRLARDIYDKLKFISLRRYILSESALIQVVFVSGWMKEVFCKNVLDVAAHGIPFHIINNSLGEKFLDSQWSLVPEPYADFVTLRRLDDSKYCIDLIVESALANPDKKYHIYGKGSYFKHYPKPANITHFDFHIKNDEIPALLSKYRCALMPTRCDAQGVMVCEMVSDFGNVKLLPLADFGQKINIKALDFSYDPHVVRQRFACDWTVEKELLLIKGITS